VRLLDDARLEASSVVANCAMNRERELPASNGYGRELGPDPVGFLTKVTNSVHSPARHHG